MKIKKKIIHTRKKYDIRPQAKHFPMMCVLAFTYICNSRCINCPYTNSNIRNSYKDAPFMSEDTFKIIADQCGLYGAWIRITGGGEPMLHPQFYPLIEYAKKVQARVGIITNGSKLTELNNKKLLETNIDMIEISVDASDKQSYETVRPGLHWDKLVHNVKNLVALRNTMNCSTRIIASGIKQKGIDIDQTKKYWQKIVDYFQARKYLTWGINNPQYSADAVPYLPPSKRIPCPFVFERLNIDTRGQVMVCGFDITGKTNMGNIHNQSIQEIWKSEKFEYFREKHLENKGDEIPLCKSCPDWKYRSWRHNYWKIVRHAEKTKNQRLNVNN